MSNQVGSDGTYKSSFVLKLVAATAVESIIYLASCGIAAQIVPTGLPQNDVVVACEVASHGGLALMRLVAAGRAKMGRGGE